MPGEGGEGQTTSYNGKLIVGKKPNEGTVEF